jgi:hypothetical protein
MRVMWLNLMRADLRRRPSRVPMSWPLLIPSPPSSRSRGLVLIGAPAQLNSCTSSRLEHEGFSLPARIASCISAPHCVSSPSVPEKRGSRRRPVVWRISPQLRRAPMRCRVPGIPPRVRVSVSHGRDSFTSKDRDVVVLPSLLDSLSNVGYLIACAVTISHLYRR